VPVVHRRHTLGLYASYTEKIMKGSGRGRRKKKKEEIFIKKMNPFLVYNIISFSLLQYSRVNFD
jgi:hypothetical protein